MSDTQYVNVAPLIDVIVGADANGEGGRLERIEHGGALPLRGLHQPQVDHLLARGLIVKAEVTGGLQSTVVDAALAAQTPPKPAAPAKQATKQGS